MSGKTRQMTKLGITNCIIQEVGTFPQMAPAPVTMAGSGQVTIPLELDLTSDTVCPIVKFDVTLELTAPSANPSKVLDNIRSVTVEHSAITGANGQPKVYTLDTATLQDAGLLATCLMSDALVKSNDLYATVNEVVAGQSSGSEKSTTYHARFALPFKLPAGHLKVTLNCQEINYAGTLLQFTSRAAYILAPRRQIMDTGAYLICDSRRIAGLSTFAFNEAAKAFAVVGDSTVNGGILDISGSGQPAQIGEMTMTQVTNQVEYYHSVLADSSFANKEVVINIDNPIPRVNRSTEMTLSLFRYDVYY